MMNKFRLQLKNVRRHTVQFSKVQTSQSFCKTAILKMETGLISIDCEYGAEKRYKEINTLLILL